MPVLDIEGLKSDALAINNQASTYLNTYVDKPKEYTITPDLLSPMVSTIVRNLKHTYVTLNKNDNEVKTIKYLVDTLSSDDIRNFNGVMKQVRDISDRMLGILDNYYATGNKVASDLLLDATSLNDQVTKLVALLSGNGLGIKIETNQELDTVKVDDIQMGQLYLVYNDQNNNFKLGICRSVIQTSRGKTISSNEDGSGAVPVLDAVYLDPSKFVSQKMIDVISYLYEYEIDTDDRELINLAQDTENKVLDFIMHTIDSKQVLAAVDYKKKYSKV